MQSDKTIYQLELTSVAIDRVDPMHALQPNSKGEKDEAWGC